MPDFAPGYQRNEQGWILFPRDVQDRKSLFFPDEVMRHPAKMNFHLQQAVIEYVAEEGQTLLDPFAGTGTLMIAALQGMRVILIDIEEGYHRLEQQALDNLRREVPEAADRVILLHGDNRFLLPIPCNHIITSPPYAQAMNIQRVRKQKEGADNWLVEQDKMMMEYSKDQRNIGRLNTFLYNQNMEKVYNLCYQSLYPAGTMTIIIKDRIRDRQRVFLSKWVDKVCKAVGFETVGWWKWKTPGHAFTSDRRSKGEEVVEDEDIMIYRKPDPLAFLNENQAEQLIPIPA